MWWNLLNNPHVILAYYSQPPELSAVEVHSVRLHRDGPAISITLDMPVYPDKPSTRWPSGANVVQVEFRFFGLHDVRLTRWGTTNIGDFTIEKVDTGVWFRFDGPNAQLDGVAQFLDIIGVSGYVKDDTAGRIL